MDMHMDEEVNSEEMWAAVKSVMAVKSRSHDNRLDACLTPMIQLTRPSSILPEARLKEAARTRCRFRASGRPKQEPSLQLSICSAA